MRQIVLDTETTGLEPKQGHRIIEIGCVEIINRRKTDNHFHQYLNPDREIDDGAFNVHGISNEFLSDKPHFADIAREFIDFIRDSELIIHNAPFDIGFINAELKQLGKKWGKTEDYCSVIDTLLLAREKHPGQKNSLDALCKRYEIDNSQRDLHGALLDAQILLDVYLIMTGGQETLGFESLQEQESADQTGIKLTDANRKPLPIIEPSEEELAAHEKQLEILRERSGGKCVWIDSGYD
ncbi:MAG: DNA polymerase III subunit epsilon [Proteobacteria bacterium]|nr:DNA polymerase III subunit epsilon [Pseudomonadota bacterium]